MSFSRFLYWRNNRQHKKNVSIRKHILDDEFRNRDATWLILHITSKDPRCFRINATPKKGSTGTKEPIDNARASFSLSVPSPLLSVSLHRRPKITRVRLAPVASMTKVGRPGPELWALTQFEQLAPEAATFVFI